MTKRSKRHEFSAPVKKILAERVGHRCSKPDCDVSTAGAAADGGVSNIGTAAHITAAAPGGPRYDPSLTPAQRAAKENGIWLCSNHGREVDSDHHRFSVQELKKWKQFAEERSAKRLGRPQPTEESATEQIKMAAQGIGKRFVPFAIRNTHRAIEAALRAEDPRFKVTTSFHGEATTFHISALEPVRLGFTLKSDLADQELAARLRELEENGVPLSLKNAKLEIQGSPLFDTLLSDMESGELELTPALRSGALKLSLRSTDHLSRESLATIPMRLFQGTKGVHCVGAAFGGLVELQAIVSLENTAQSRFTIGVNTKHWEGVDVQALEHFDDVYNFFLKCASGWTLTIDLTCEGLPVCKSVAMQMRDEGFVQSTTRHLIYAKAVRSIGKFLKVGIPARFETPINSEEARTVKELGKFLAANGTMVPSFKAFVSLNPGAIELQAHKAKSLPYIVLDHAPVNVRVFDTLVEIPPTRFAILNVIMQRSPESSDPLDAMVTATESSEFKLLRDDEFAPTT